MTNLKIIMKRNLFALYILLVFVSCKTTKNYKSSFEGKYFQELNKNFGLILNNNQFSYFENFSGHLSLYCCDTIAKGNYYVDYTNNLIYLSSSKYLNNSILKINVEEKKTIIYDSIVFEIISPIELFDDGSKGKRTRFFYQIALHGDDPIYFDEILAKRFETNIFKIYIPKGVVFDKFQVDIYPNFNNLNLRNISTQYISTINYNIIDKTTNHFKITIPDLTFSYLSFLRLNKDIVRIVNEDKLEWDGHYFIKQ